MSKRDYYEILGLSREAPPREIKSAYRRLALKYHPDKNPGDRVAEENFKEAAEAYSVLSDPEKRSRYDQFGHSGLGAQPGFDPEIFSDFSDIFGDFFGFGDLFGGRTGRGRNRAQRGSDLRYDLQISFEEAVLGVKTKVKIPRNETCTTCAGTGAEHPQNIGTCPACAGQGQVRYQQGFFAISKTCSKCGGTGRVITEPCGTCRGSGRVQKERTLEIGIPAGVDHGTRLRVVGEGESGVNSGSSGDLYVVVNVSEHPFFRRQDDDLHCEVPLTFSQAALGTEIEVPTLTGKEKIRIPAGTQTGTVFRLKNRGITRLGGRGNGDQYVTVRVATPKNLTPEQKDLFRRLAELSAEDQEDAASLFDKVREMFG